MGVSGASIFVGGRVSAQQLRGLHAAANASRIGFDWEDDERTWKEWCEWLEENLGRVLPLYATDHEPDDLAPLEAYCQAEGLPYEVHYQAYQESSPEVRWWSPDSGGVQRSLATQTGDCAVTLHELKAVLAKGGEQGVRDLIARYTPPDLPRFEITGGIPVVP